MPKNFNSKIYDLSQIFCDNDFVIEFLELNVFKILAKISQNQIFDFFIKKYHFYLENAKCNNTK